MDRDTADINFEWIKYSYLVIEQQNVSKKTFEYSTSTYKTTSHVTEQDTTVHKTKRPKSEVQPFDQHMKDDEDQKWHSFINTYPFNFLKTARTVNTMANSGYAL